MTQKDSNSLNVAVSILRADGAQQYEIDHFVRQFTLRQGGFDGYIAEDSILPLPAPLSLDELTSELEPSHTVASLKLNGGLGTTMGLKGPKSLLPVKGDRTFLSIVLQQYEHGLQGDRLLLMNSFNTHDKISDLLNDSENDNVICFEQGRVPRLQEADLMPLNPHTWGNAAWCPPGHGQLIDILLNGLGQQLLDQGMRYLFVSNIDNLGATVNHAIPKYMADNNVSWLTEVCQREPSDRKGGHLAIDKDSGKLLVRDTAMVAKVDIDDFQNITKHQYFNTNNLWIDIAALLSDEFDHQDLPLIVNHKQVSHNGLQADVVQFETGLGTAISNFENAQTLQVPRSRFIPVKDISQWLVLRSDWFTLQSNGLLTETDTARRPAIASDVVMQGNAAETLSYYLGHPDLKRHLQDILQ